MAIRSDRVGYGQIHIQTRNFYPYPNPTRTRKIPENEYPNPIQWILDRIRVYPKPEIFWIGYPKSETQTRNLKIFIIINIALEIVLATWSTMRYEFNHFQSLYHNINLVYICIINILLINPIRKCLFTILTS